MARTLKAINEQLRTRRHEDPKQTGVWLGRVLQGWLNYYAVPTSHPILQRFRHGLKIQWLLSLRRRSQEYRFPRKRLEALCADLRPPIRIIHPWPNTRFAVNHSS